MIARFVRRRKMQGLTDVADFQKAFPGFGEAVFKRIKMANEKHRLHGAKAGGAQHALEAGGRKLSQATSAIKRYPRLPQLPLRAPGIVRPTHASVTKLRMFKYTQRHGARGLFRQPPSSAPPQKPSAVSSYMFRIADIVYFKYFQPLPEPPQQQHVGTPQITQQHPNVVPQAVSIIFSKSFVYPTLKAASRQIWTYGGPYVKSDLRTLRHCPNGSSDVHSPPRYSPPN
ncbi:unnamed protein product [Cylicostephanus goldi]|uniref:Uncharacterized protein n=1 Tax=Cylicostephanus goldi TaxID=71465 RepID=A0A3P6TAX5_CYLGO|nr:unnamed protein product [Cylicostephanus goldi]